jgi:hypothetical protein
MEEEQPRRTFGDDLLDEGVRGKIYELPGTGNSFKVMGIIPEENDRDAKFTGISLYDNGAGETSSYRLAYLIDKPRNLKLEEALAGEKLFVISG